MLDQTTKRKLDSVRQILVGKVPDPKAQVEQITTALIYKFMDDMDKESEELGGEAKFFANGFLQYAWIKLMDQRLSGQERLDLYVRAITNMSKNPHIPQLFRDIFKGASLPYNDPRTLSLFLKEINEFSYEHSENLGNAFEYLLSILGSQGEAGQFRTPRHIIDFIVEVVAPKKNETILDPACGTAGFLISAYKHILKTNKEKKLTPDEKLKLMNNLAGYDISPDMVKLALVNMYLHGFPEPKIHEYDSLTSEKRWNEYADVILANPPFMSPKGGIRPHNRFSVKSKRSEALFVDYIAEHLTPRGRAGIIVPEGIIFKAENAYKKLRQMLVEEVLFAVVSLPSGVFNPYAGVKTSVLFFDNQLAKRTDEILFVKIENDGFDLGAQRRPIEKNDLPEVLKVLQAWKSGEKQESGLAVWAKKEKIAESGDYNLTAERYREVEVRVNQKWPMVELSQITEVAAGNSAPQDKKLFQKGTYPFFRTADVGAVHIHDNLVQTKDKLNKEGTKGLKLFSKNTILFPKSGASTFLNHRVMIGIDGYVSSHLACIKAQEYKVLPNFLFHFLIKIDARNLTADQSYPSLRLSQIEKIKIPLPPIKIQKEIVEEIEQYQKVIDGARQVVENWKPKFRIDPDWDIVELNEVCDVISGQSPEGKYYNENQNGLPFYQGKIEFQNMYIGEPKKWTTQITKIALRNDILMSVRAPVGPVNFATQKICIGRGLASIRGDKEKIDQKYLFYILKNKEVDIQGNTGATFASINRNDIQKIKIPIPSLEVQKQIVAQIEAEHKAIEECKKLIEKMENKIEVKIGEVWGDGNETQ